MPSAQTSGIAALRLFRGLLYLYPSEFRDEYGRELTLVFADRWRETRSPGERVRVWLETLSGILLEAPKEQFHVVHRDVLYAARLMFKHRASTAVAIALIALGIGASTLVFTLANGLLLRPLPYGNSDRVVAVDEFSPSDPNEFGSVSIPNFADLRARSKLFDDLGLYRAAELTLRGDGPAEHIPAGVVSAGTLRILGVSPLLGHVFTAAEDVPNGPAVVLLGEGLWERRFGRDSNIVGRLLKTGGRPLTIVGVMPASFTFPGSAELWVPLRENAAQATRTDYFLHALGRLKPGVTTAQATAELDALLAEIHREHPEADNGWHARTMPFRDVLAATYKPSVVTLLVAVNVLLLIACANVANLLLLRASARAREMSLRKALGASRRRLVRQLVTESLMLGLTGGVLGVGFAYLGVPALLSLIPVELPKWMVFSVDGRVLAFALGASVVTSLLFGLAPALAASRSSLIQVLHDGGRTGTGGLARRLRRHGLVIAEVALSVMLLAGAGLMIRSFLALRTQPLGYSPDRVLSFVVDYPRPRYPDGARSRALLQALAEQLRSIPGVESCAFTTGLPLGGGAWTRIFTVEGRPMPLQQMPFVNHVIITPGYLRTVGIPVLQGRDFTDEDFATGSALIVAQSFAAKYWPGESALGKRVQFGPPAGNGPWHTIVGIVADSRQGELKVADDANVYLPFGAYEASVTPSAAVIRTTGDPMEIVRTARERITAVDRDIALNSILTLDQIVDRAAWRDRFVAYLFGIFAAMALVLAGIGLYGLLAYTVALQTREIGIRLALGASATGVWRMLIGRGLLLCAAGLAIGLAGALAGTRLLATQLFAVSPHDPATFVATASAVAGIALVASLVPAFRAARVDPIAALRVD